MEGSETFEVEKRRLGLRTKMIWFAERPMDIDGVSAVYFMDCLSKVDEDGFEREDRYTFTIDLRKGQDKLWSDMASKCRSEIRKAEKEGITIRMDQDYERFLKLNEEFRQSKGLSYMGYTKEFMQKIAPPLPDCCTLLTAEHDGEMIGGVLFLRGEREMIGIIGASKRLVASRESQNLIAHSTRLTYWEGMKFGVENGYEVMDLGAYDPTDPALTGVDEFKVRLGGAITPSYRYTKYYVPGLKWAVKTSRSIGRWKTSRAEGPSGATS